MDNLSKSEFFQRYDIDIRDGRLGGGAFGTVYKSWDNLKDEWKAIKIAEVKIINGKEFSLISEFDATKRLPIHKNIINYESVHTFAMPNGMFDYAVMQYYPHGNLKQLVKKENLDKSHKVELIIGLFRGLEVLHKHGVKHRDLKPSNILISERKGHFTPKIADFGLAKYTNDGDLSAVTNSFGGGTLEYSSPEQLLGEPLRDNTDIWAIGVIAYELFVGHIPFVASDASSRPEVKRRAISQNIVNAPIPPEIENCPNPYRDIITKCLIKDPEKRIKSAGEILQIINQHTKAKAEAIIPIGVKADMEDEGTIIVTVDEQLKSIDKIKEVERSKQDEKLIALAAEKEKLANLKAKEEQKKENERVEKEKQKQEKIEKERIRIAEIEAAKLKEKQDAIDAEKVRLANLKAKEEREKQEEIEKKRLKKESEAKKQEELLEAERKRVKAEKVALAAKNAKLQEEKKKKEKQERIRLEKEEKAKKDKAKRRKDKEEAERRKAQQFKEKQLAEKKRKEEIQKNKIAQEKKKALAEEVKIRKREEAKEKRKKRALFFRNKGISTLSKLSKYRKQIVAVLLFGLISFGGFKAVQYINEVPSFYESNGLYGLRSANGELLSEAIYSSYEPFSWGFAKATKDGDIYKIDRYGNASFLEKAAINNTINENITEVNNQDNKVNFRSKIAAAQSLDTLLALAEHDASIVDDERYKLKKAELLSEKDDNEWNEARATNTIDAYSYYIDAQANGEHIDEANKIMKALIDKQLVDTGSSDEAMYQNAIKSGQVSQLRYYLEKYPNGMFVESAKTEIGKYEGRQRQAEWKVAKQKNSTAGYQTIRDKYPNKDVAKLAREAQSKLISEQITKEWNAVKSSNDIAALKDFLRRYPSSQYKSEVTKTINTLNAQIKTAYQDTVNVLLLNGSLAQLERIAKNTNAYKKNEIDKRIAQLKKEIANKTEEPPIVVESDNTPFKSIMKVITDNMIKIPSGSYLMGCKEQCKEDNSPAIEVSVKEFYLAKYEVTQEEYEAVMGGNPSTYNDCKKCPVENVSFYDAQKYIEKINESYNTNYRLPTEKEWEYAAKAGRQYKYAGGNDIIKVGVYKSNSNNGTQRRGSKNKNKFGLYDMTGNVHEWCDSKYTKNGYGSDKKTSNEKVIRGGSWRSKSSDCRVDTRGKSVASTKNGWTGFRLARD